jgi:hypothetical protein
MTVATAAVWSGKQIKPAVAVKVDGKTLSPSEYTIGYGTNKDIGKGSVTIKANSTAYKGSKTAVFTINPKTVSFKKLVTGKRLINATWNKVASAQKITGYKLQYRAKGTSKWSSAKSINAKNAKYTIKKLKKGKKYEVRLCAYKKITSGASKGTYYGEWTVKSSGKVK